MTIKRIFGVLLVLVGLCIAAIMVDHAQVVYDYVSCSPTGTTYAGMKCFWEDGIIGKIGYAVTPVLPSLIICTFGLALIFEGKPKMPMKKIASGEKARARD
jgi:hypothetical protein